MPDYTARRTTMVDTQVRPSDVTKFPIIDAMLSVKREAFVPDDRREAAYIGELCNLGAGRFILEPRDFAKLLDALNVQPDELVLDLGSGLGYSAAVLGHMAQAVIALEEQEELAQASQDILANQNALNVAASHGVLAQGSAQNAPYDVIVIEGAVQNIPQNLLDQLADGGRIAAIVDEQGCGALKIGHKKANVITWQFICNINAPLLPGFEKNMEFAL